MAQIVKSETHLDLVHFLGGQPVIELTEGTLPMTRLVLTIDAAAADKARRIAQQRKVTLDSLIQELIDGLDVSDQATGLQACNVLDESFRLVSAPFGGKSWTNAAFNIPS